MGRHCSEQLTVLPGTDDRPLYIHALWQLPELLKLTNLFEDRQSTPERTLRWLPLCSFQQFCCCFSQLHSFSPFFCLGSDLLIRFVHISEDDGIIPIVSEAILVILVRAFLVWLRPLFVLVRCFLCWQNANLAGRFACRRCCLVFVCRFFSMDLPRFLKPKCFMLFARYFTASLTVRT